jgi:hypothetical protein
MLYVYDLDGTLADTKEAVVEAYRSVGVEPPEDFFGKSWQEWLFNSDGSLNVEAHTRKNEAYVHMLQHNPHLIRRLPMADLAERTGGVILTAASPQSASAVCAVLNLSLVILAGFTIEGKIQTLRRWSGRKQEMVIFDDDLRNVEAFRADNKEWTVCHVRY